MDQVILDAIPQRPPFLFVDKIINITKDTVLTEKFLSPELDFFKGHFPGKPIMPGVLLCECCFQSGAILVNQEHSNNNDGDQVGVVTRIKNSKFKSFARPGDTLVIYISLIEQISNAFYMKGKISVDNKVIMQINFQVAMADL